MARPYVTSTLFVRTLICHASVMTVRVGIIGVGVMGADHARKLNGTVARAEVTAVADFDTGRAKAVADEMRAATVVPDGVALIRRAEVDAVVIASHDSTHAELALAAIGAGKPVMCEKPLAATADECRSVIAAQRAGGVDLISLGFMRRFDPGYLELKRQIDDGDLGDILVAHAVSRTVAAGPGDSATTITNSAIHELDIMPWLLDSPITQVSWHGGRSTRHANGRQDPQLMLLRTQSDVMITVEVFLNARYGYDTRCEVVGEYGTAALSLPNHVVVDHDRKRFTAYPADWIPRYTDAYRLELQEWIDAVEQGRPPRLASAEDGLRASLVADALVESMMNAGRLVPVGE
jgi:myo-inositol 2-dehydrogenase / D-chiro-inositol 1-dehydrogenase